MNYLNKFNIRKIKLFREIILGLSIILFFSNVVYFNVAKTVDLKEKFFKFSDFFIFNLCTKIYKDLSKYLTDKYYINFDSFKIIPKIKKEIKIKSIGLFDKSFHLNWLQGKLDKEFIIKFDENNPDYLIYNVFTEEDIKNKYKNSIKIAIYTENVMPDFNLADYIIAHYHIIYLDRYFKYSIFLWSNFEDIEKKRKKLLKKPLRKKFCAALISNCFSNFRMAFISKLNEYKKVDMGGKCENNIKVIIKNKIEFLSNYKFSIAMENSNGDGYLSEKIADSFIAGTIPIYYGDYVLDEFINPKSYILIKGEKDIEKKIEYIKKIDQDDNLYKAILKEKPIIDNNFAYRIDEIEIKSFLKNIFNQDKNKASRRDNYFYDFKEDCLLLSFNLNVHLILLFLF